MVGLQNGPKKLILTMNAEQKVLPVVKFYYYIMIGIMVFVSVMAIISAVVFVLRRRRFSGYVIDNSINLDHFDIYMPSRLA